MTKAVTEQFDILITIDKNLQFQQNIQKHNLIERIPRHLRRGYKLRSDIFF